MTAHRAAIRIDFRRMGVSFDEVGASVRYGEAMDYVERLAHEFGTHTHAALSGWEWPATVADLMATSHVEAYYNVHRDPKKHPKPYSFARPWPDVEVVDPELRAALDQQLEARSAFRK